jgi:hypothetical protein
MEIAAVANATLRYVLDLSSGKTAAFIFRPGFFIVIVVV